MNEISAHDWLQTLFHGTTASATVDLNMTAGKRASCEHSCGACIADTAVSAFVKAALKDQNWWDAFDDYQQTWKAVQTLAQIRIPNPCLDEQLYVSVRGRASLIP